MKLSSDFHYAYRQPVMNIQAMSKVVKATCYNASIFRQLIKLILRPFMLIKTFSSQSESLSYCNLNVRTDKEINLESWIREVLF